MKNFLSFFSNVKRILDALSTIESQLARLLYISGVLAQNVVIEPTAPTNLENISVDNLSDKS